MASNENIANKLVHYAHRTFQQATGERDDLHQQHGPRLVKNPEGAGSASHDRPTAPDFTDSAKKIGNQKDVKLRVSHLVNENLNCHQEP